MDGLAPRFRDSTDLGWMSAHRIMARRVIAFTENVRIDERGEADERYIFDPAADPIMEGLEMRKGSFEVQQPTDALASWSRQPGKGQKSG